MHAKFLTFYNKILFLGGSVFFGERTLGSRIISRTSLVLKSVQEEIERPAALIFRVILTFRLPKLNIENGEIRDR